MLSIDGAKAHSIELVWPTGRHDAEQATNKRQLRHAVAFFACREDVMERETQAEKHPYADLAYSDSAARCEQTAAACDTQRSGCIGSREPPRRRGKNHSLTVANHLQM